MRIVPPFLSGGAGVLPPFLSGAHVRPPTLQTPTTDHPPTQIAEMVLDPTGPPRQTKRIQGSREDCLATCRFQVAGDTSPIRPQLAKLLASTLEAIQLGRHLEDLHLDAGRVYLSAPTPSLRCRQHRRPTDGATVELTYITSRRDESTADTIK